MLDRLALELLSVLPVLLCEQQPQLPWVIDFLALVASLSDAICRRREGQRDLQFASLMPGVSEAAWPLEERYALLRQLKVWSGCGDGATVKRAEEVELRYMLREESDAAKRTAAAIRVERGARLGREATPAPGEDDHGRRAALAHEPARREHLADPRAHLVRVRPLRGAVEDGHRRRRGRRRRRRLPRRRRARSRRRGPTIHPRKT